MRSGSSPAVAFYPGAGFGFQRVGGTRAAPESGGMYVPRHFAVEDRAQILAFIRRHPFGVLVSCEDGVPAATHLPFVVLDEEPLRLGTHVARANPHWERIAQGPALAIFSGAHAHVSAAWYAQPATTVPTWNYAAVHCYAAAAVTGGEDLRRILEALVREHEGPDGWSFEGADSSAVSRMLAAIAGIELRVDRIEAKFKYSQNRSEDDRSRVIAHLRESTFADARALAADMSAYYDTQDAAMLRP